MEAKDINKFKEIFIYIISKVGARVNVFTDVIYIILYFIDFNFYGKYNRHIMGLTYKKIQGGPMPCDIDEIIDKMASNQEIRIITPEFCNHPLSVFRHRTQSKYFPLRGGHLDYTSGQEIEVVNNVMYSLISKSAADIFQCASADGPCFKTDHNQIISYELVRDFPLWSRI